MDLCSVVAVVAAVAVAAVAEVAGNAAGAEPLPLRPDLPPGVFVGVHQIPAGPEHQLARWPAGYGIFHAG